jgi:signal transduction histidine kinase
MPSSTVEKYPQLISLAVHEFRTPASVVGGYLRMLQRDSDQPLSERQRKMIDEAEKSCTRLVALIAELSEIGKLDAGLVNLNLKPLDLRALLREVAEHVHEAKDRDVHLALRCDGPAASINGDAVRLRSAFDAIFRSILREKAGPATVVAECRRDVVDGRNVALIVVADQERVQDAYGRARAAFDEKRGGMGLALPLARRVFEGHGGQLFSPEGTDDPVSRGSAIIVLPLTE